MGNRTRDLTPEQNEKVRALLATVLQRPGLTQSALAKTLGVTQPTLSAFLGERQGTSYAFASKLAAFVGVRFDTLGIATDEEQSVQPMQVTRRFVVRDERYPNRTEACAIAEDEGLLPAAIAHVREYRLDSEEDLPVRDWCRLIRDEHNRLKRLAELGIAAGAPDPASESDTQAAKAKTRTKLVKK